MGENEDGGVVASEELERGLILDWGTSLLVQPENAETVSRLDEAFRQWRSENSHALELDGTGDVYALLAALVSAASQKS